MKTKTLKELALVGALGVAGYFGYKKWSTLAVDPTIATMTMRVGQRLQPSEAPLSVTGLVPQSDGSYLASAPGTAEVFWSSGSFVTTITVS